MQLLDVIFFYLVKKEYFRNVFYKVKTKMKSKCTCFIKYQEALLF